MLSQYRGPYKIQYQYRITLNTLYRIGLRATIGKDPKRSATRDKAKMQYKNGLADGRSRARRKAMHFS